MPPLSWTGLEKTEEHREIIAARQNPCELISHLHRQPLALEVYIDDPPVITRQSTAEVWPLAKMMRPRIIPS